MADAVSWKCITTDCWLLKVVRAGYKLHFHLSALVSRPVGRWFLLKGPKLAAPELAIRISQGSDLCTRDADTTPGFYSPVFLVPKKNTSDMLMIINLKILNKDYLVRPPNFQMFHSSKLWMVPALCTQWTKIQVQHTPIRHINSTMATHSEYLPDHWICLSSSCKTSWLHR